MGKDTHDSGVKIGGKSGIQRGGRQDAITWMGWATGQHLIEYSAERIQIGARVQRPPAELFWSHVVGCANRRSHRRMRGTWPPPVAKMFGFDAANAPKPGQNRARLAQENVLRLERAVNQTARVDRAERRVDLSSDLYSVAEIEWSTIPNVLQRIAHGSFDKRHDKKIARTILAGALDGQNVRMRQLMDKRSFVSEACDRLWIESAGGGEHFD